jgi:hypothetical protein
MGNRPSTPENPSKDDYYFRNALASFQQSNAYMVNCFSFLLRAYVAILFTLSVQQPETYNDSIEILDHCSKKAFEVYITLDHLMIDLRLRRKRKYLRRNPYFNIVIKRCLKNTGFDHSIDLYSMPPAMLEIFFSTLQKVVTAELEKINFFSPYVTEFYTDVTVFRSNEVRFINLDMFDANYRGLMIRYDSLQPGIKPRSVLQHGNFFQVFRENLLHTIKMIGFESHLRNKFTTPEWFLEDIDSESKNMLTSAVSRMVEHWKFNGCPKY